MGNQFFILVTMSLLRYLSGVLAVMSMACQPSNPPALDHEEAAVLVRAAPEQTAEERALANLVASRVLLQSVIDGNTALERQERPFSCTAQEGGLLVCLSDSAEVHSWRLARTKAEGQEIIHWYYRQGTLMFVAHERSQWQGDQEAIVQTLLYTRGKTVLHSQQKTVQGTEAVRAQQLEGAALLPVPVDTVLWQRLQGLEARLALTHASTEAWTQRWCAE